MPIARLDFDTRLPVRRLGPSARTPEDSSAPCVVLRDRRPGDRPIVIATWPTVGYEGNGAIRRRHPLDMNGCCARMG